MAKRKRKKVSKKTKLEFNIQLYGVLLLVAAILGIGKYGPVGRLIASFSLFLAGSLYMPFLVVLFIIGGYVLIKKSWPEFFSTKLVGLYVFVLGLLILMHREFVVQNDGNITLIFKETINQLMTGFNSIMNNGILDDWYAVGGGLIGGVFSLLFVKLFAYTGMMIVSWVLMIAGISMFTGFSIVDFVSNGVTNRKEKKTKDDEKKKVKISDGNDVEEEEEVSKVKISSIDELSKVPVKDSSNVSSGHEIKEEKEEKVSSNKSYQLPPLSILDQPKKKSNNTDNSAVEKNIENKSKMH